MLIGSACCAAVERDGARLGYFQREACCGADAAGGGSAAPGQREQWEDGAGVRVSFADDGAFAELVMMPLSVSSTPRDRQRVQNFRVTVPCMSAAFAI